MREFEELLLDNALLKVQNQTLVKKNPKWENLWQTIHEITEEQIQDNFKIVCANEKAYLNELLHTSYNLKVIHMISLVTNWLKYPSMFSRSFHLCS